MIVTLRVTIKYFSDRVNRLLVVDLKENI